MSDGNMDRIAMADDILEYWMSLSRELASRFNIEEFDSSSAMWSWENFGEDIKTLRNRLGVGKDHVNILGLRVNLFTGETMDLFTGDAFHTSRIIPHLYYYSRAKDKGIGNEWVKFGALRGSWACRYSFDEENVNALTQAFVENREGLFKALEKMGAKRVDFGEFAFELLFLPKVKILIAFEKDDEEFPASVRLLYDSNSIFYLPHEQLGDISWFLVSRAMKAL
ncbi:MAG: DUF3786 domain-containing protein [Candidatus Thorarchaeota archaeon]